MVRLYIEPEAEAELEETADRYAEMIPDLGLEFLAEMRKRTGDVLAHPERFPWFEGVDDVRCAHSVGRFPHLIVYLLDGDTVHVVAYMHPRQRPGYWNHRLR